MKTIIDYPKFRVGFYDEEERNELYNYFQDEQQAYEDFINRRQFGEVWLEKLVNGDEYETTQSYNPDEDEDKTDLL